LNAGVTCCRKADGKKKEQARTWADELGLPYIPRKEDVSVPVFLDGLGMDWLLVATEQGPFVYTRTGKLGYHPGMAPLRILELKRGGTDQMVNALGLKPGMKVFDGTMGLAADSVVAGFAVGETGKIIGTEASLPMAFLLRKGLGTYDTGKRDINDVLRRIEVHHMPAKEYLSGVPADSFDVCYFDPMFQTPTKNSSAMDSLRPVACMDPLDRETIALALRAAPVAVIKERGERSLREYGCTEISGSPNAHFRFGRIYRDPQIVRNPKLD